MSPQELKPIVTMCCSNLMYVAGSSLYHVKLLIYNNKCDILEKNEITRE